MTVDLARAGMDDRCLDAATVQLLAAIEMQPENADRTDLRAFGHDDLRSTADKPVCGRSGKRVYNGNHGLLFGNRPHQARGFKHAGSGTAR